MGTTVSAGLQGFRQGFGLMNSVYDREDQKEDRALRREDMQLQREDRQVARQDKDKAKREQEIQRRSLALHDLNQQFSQMAEDDPNREAIAAKVREEFGAIADMSQLSPETFVSPVGEQGYIVGKQFMEGGGDMSVFADRKNRAAVGEVIAGATIRKGRADLPTKKGKRRTSQEMYDVIHHEDGTVTFASMITDEDGFREIVPITEKGTAGDDDLPRAFPVEKLIDRTMGFTKLYEGLDSAGMMPMLRYAYLRAGGNPSAFTPPKGNRKVVGGEEDSYIVDMDTGERVPLGIGAKRGRGSNSFKLHTDADGNVHRIYADKTEATGLSGAVRGSGKGKGGAKETAFQSDIKFIQKRSEEEGTKLSFNEAVALKKRATSDPGKEVLTQLGKMQEAQVKARIRPGHKDYKTEEQMIARAKQLVALARGDVAEEGAQPPPQSPPLKPGQEMPSMQELSPEAADAFFRELPSGAEFIDPEGVRRRKP